MIGRKQQIAIVAALYLALAVGYGMTLELTSQWSAEQVAVRCAIDYALKGIWSAAVAYVLFGLLNTSSASLQLATAATLALPYAFVWRGSYYWMCDALEIGHLGPAGSWWDIYIPLLVYGLTFGVLFAARAHNQSLAALRRNERLQAAATESELAALKAQTNPHFLYNTLNAVSAGLTPAQESVRETLAQLADLLRYQVVAADSDTLPVVEELAFVRNYLAISSTRMGARLSFEVTSDPAELRSLAMPPMLLQPLVENAVLHGLTPKLEGGSVTVSVRRVGDALRFVVTDDGVGFGSGTSGGTGVGLRQVRRRLKLRFGAELRIVSAPGKGATVAFDLPTSELVVRHSSARPRGDELSLGPRESSSKPETTIA